MYRLKLILAIFIFLCFGAGTNRQSNIQKGAKSSFLSLFKAGSGIALYVGFLPRFLFFYLSLVLSFSVFAASNESIRTSYAQAVKKAAPSVVNIYTIVKLVRYSYLNGQPQTYVLRKKLSLGSGVIMNEKGYILTNYHVIRRANVVMVAVGDGREIKAKLIGSDPETDVTVLKIDLNNLQPIKIDQSANIQVGDIVLAIGNPFGLGQTVTQGIVSAIGRTTIGLNPLENYIQTDAAINPGNSGGALINVNGELIGINTGIYSRSGGYQGVGFAIPVSIATNIMNQIIAGGSVQRGWLGVSITTLTPALARELRSTLYTGVVVTNVMKDSPAARAGLRSGDIITQLNGHLITSSQGFLSYVAQSSPDSTVTLIYYRAGRKNVLDIKLGKRPPPPSTTNRTITPEQGGNTIGGNWVPDDRR